MLMFSISNYNLIFQLQKDDNLILANIYSKGQSYQILLQLYISKIQLTISQSYKIYNLKMRTLQTAFQQFEKSKVKFAQQLADFAAKPQNIDNLYTLGVLKQLRPLLLDPTVSIQNSAALALGRIANHSQKMAESVVQNQVLPQLVMSLSQQNVFYKKAACFVLRSLAKHSSTLSKSIINSGALQSLAVCVQQFDPGVKQSAAWALAYIAKHNEILAREVAESGCVPGLVLALQEPDPNLKRIAALAINQIAKHSMDLAQTTVDAGAVPYLTQNINHHDAQLKKQVCQCLSNIAKHSLELAETVAGSELFPKILYKLKDHDQGVRKMAASVIREVVKQSPQMAKLFVEAGGISATIDFLNENKDVTRLPGIVALGYVGAYSQKSAMSIIQGKGIAILKDSLIQIPDDLVKGASAWALGQIGGHSNKHANILAGEEVLTHLLAVYIYNNSTDQLKKKAKKAIKNIVIMTTQIIPLEPIIQDSPAQIQVYLIKQLSKIIAKDKQARKVFASNEGLRKIQQIKPQQGSKLQEAIQQLVALYPADIAQYYSADYETVLVNKV